jgi:hypothetical protein
MLSSPRRGLSETIGSIMPFSVIHDMTQTFSLEVCIFRQLRSMPHSSLLTEMATRSAGTSEQTDAKEPMRGPRSWGCSLSGHVGVDPGQDPVSMAFCPGHQRLPCGDVIPNFKYINWWMETRILSCFGSEA